MRTTKRTQEGGFTGFQLKVYSEAERKQGDEGRKCLKEVGRSSPEFGNYWTDLPPGGGGFRVPDHSPTTQERKHYGVYREPPAEMRFQQAHRLAGAADM